jgi:DNA-binding NarL/FixJ family response regulator
MAPRSFVSTRADWVSVLEAAHREVKEDDVAWAGGISTALERILPSAAGLGMLAIEHRPDFSSVRPLLGYLPKMFEQLSPEQALDNAMGRFGTQFARPFFYPPTSVATHLEVARACGPPYIEGMAAYHASMGVRDVLGVIAYPEPNVVLVAYAAFDREIVLSPYERRMLAKLALHLESAFRLRRNADIVLAEVSRGRVELREGSTLAATTIAEHVTGVDRARTKGARAHADAIELWPALVAGEASLVERVQGSKRTWVVVRNPPRSHRARALSRSEMDAVAMASRGLPTKMIAYALGVSSSTVSGRLASAAAKLGVGTRSELVRVASLLMAAPEPSPDLTHLTDAERDVLALLREGLSNNEIAKARARSVRTVANQVASVLRKTGKQTRRGLLVVDP